MASSICSVMLPLVAAKYESGGNPDQVGGDGGNACGEFQFDNRYELGPLWNQVKFRYIKQSHG